MLMLLLMLLRLRLMLLLLLLLLLLLMLLLMLLMLLVLMLVKMLLPKCAPSKSAAKASPKSIRASYPAARISSTLVVPTVRTTTGPIRKVFPICFTTPFPFTLSGKTLLAHRRHSMSCPTSAPETISKVLDLKSVSAGARQ
jgi:hypothetical protein